MCRGPNGSLGGVVFVALLRGRFRYFRVDNITVYLFYIYSSFPNLSAESKAGSIYLLSKAAGLYLAASSGSA